MRHTEIKLRDLITWEDHDEAIRSIESDYLNVYGGWEAWTSGKETYLLEGAKNKIRAIRKRQDRLFPDSIFSDYE